MSPMLCMGIALALSLAGNAWQARLYLGQRDTLTIAQTERDNARGVATACSDATDALRDLANQRAAEAKAARAAAADKAIDHRQRAQLQLQAPPAVPGDDCRSAEARARSWLRDRSAP